MILFRLTLPQKDICTEQDLYFRNRSDNRHGVEHIERQSRIVMAKNSLVSFDTFFNCFSYSRYVKYTDIDLLQITLSLRGSFNVRLFIRKDGGIPALLSERDVDNKGTQNILIEQPLTVLSGEGFLYIELLALSDGAVFSGGYYGCPDSATREVKLAVVICSYRHEDYVYHNAAMLGRYLALPYNQDFHDSLSLLVIDNGQTLEREKLEFDRAELFYNRNLGGSGGFARGMIEASRSPENFTHMCLMDDDVCFDPEILFKTVSLLRMLRKEYRNISVGGIMLEQERPYVQYEMGGIWTGRQIFNVRSGYDIRLASEVLTNEKEIPVDYNAWWYMCMPVSFVKEKGLPLPLFIKGDDMDYGIRATEGVVLMNGVAVWHEGFGKKYNGALEYYIKRNELILNALHKPDYGMLPNLMKLLSSCGKQIVFQRYTVAGFIIRAYEDFLKGAWFLWETDGERLNRELMEQNIPLMDDMALTEKLDAEFHGIQFYPMPEKAPCRLFRVLTFYSHLIPRCFYSKRQRYRVIEIADTSPLDFLKPVDFYKAEHVVQYNGGAHKGFITSLKKSEAVKYIFSFIIISWKMLIGYSKAVKSYRENWRELTGMEAWMARLDLSQEGRKS